MIFLDFITDIMKKLVNITLFHDYKSQRLISIFFPYIPDVLLTTHLRECIFCSRIVIFGSNVKKDTSSDGGVLPNQVKLRYCTQKRKKESNFM